MLVKTPTAAPRSLCGQLLPGSATQHVSCSVHTEVAGHKGSWGAGVGVFASIPSGTVRAGVGRWSLVTLDLAHAHYLQLSREHWHLKADPHVLIVGNLGWD